MRLCLVAVVPVCMLATGYPLGAAAGQQKHFPYNAYVTADDVYIRGGPGKNYYPTSKLQAGDVVEVYRHDPGGWYAIRPPEGSFSWVSGKYLELRSDGLAEVRGEQVAARVGSQFSAIRDVIQVRLHEGELVEILDSKEFGSQPGAGTWYKIAPPSGEFRWIFGKYVDPNYTDAGVRTAPADHSPLVEQSRGAAASIADPVVRADHESAVGSDSEIVDAHQWAPVSSQDDSDRRYAASTGVDPDRYTNTFEHPAVDPAGSPTIRRLSPEEFQQELDEVNLELSIMLVEEPTVWSFDELRMRAESLVTQAETAVERGRARTLLRKIEQSADVKRRYDKIGGMRSEIERHSRQASDLDRALRDARSADEPEGRFDATGELRRVVSKSASAPPYALVDEKGNVRCFVTPAPDVKMQYYLDRRVGVTGIRGYIAERRARHITAKHVTALDDAKLR